MPTSHPSRTPIILDRPPYQSVVTSYACIGRSPACDAPGKLKYLAGSESAMGAFIMDLTPEQSAEQLKAVAIKL